ncbi:hypothetical protein LOK49_Contig25G00013 [Camellia lanceoleosa]|nr:hypothetical protein LOK49_Contig25G00013 [Camellia lanceoleosa]
MVVDTIDAAHRRWKVEDLRGLVSANEVKAICSIPISLAHQEDTQIWHYERKGDYTVKSGCHIVDGEDVLDDEDVDLENGDEDVDLENGDEDV